MLDIDVITGGELKILLKKRGVSQKMMIELIGINQTTISRYFSDRLKMPADFLIKAAYVAGLSLNDLITRRNPDSYVPIHRDAELKASERSNDYMLNFNLKQRLISVENELNRLKNELKSASKVRHGDINKDQN